jgi:hypothetical protein
MIKYIIILINKMKINNCIKIILKSLLNV